VYGLTVGAARLNFWSSEILRESFSSYTETNWGWEFLGPQSLHCFSRIKLPVDVGVGTLTTCMQDAILASIDSARDSCGVRFVILTSQAYGASCSNTVRN
jgi:hypothetical protein